MDQGLKERLVGAAVLVAIAVWLIPWVLDGPDESADPTVSSLQLPASEEPMPMRTQTLRLGDDGARANAGTAPAAAAPVAEAPAEPTPARADASTAAASTDAEPTATPPEPERPAAQIPVPEARVAATSPPKPSAPTPAGDWAVQLGVFGEQANARRLAERAGTFGYKAEVSSYRSDGKTMYRVRVGPQATRAAADAAASALRAHGIEARVVAAR